MNIDKNITEQLHKLMSNSNKQRITNGKN